MGHAFSTLLSRKQVWDNTLKNGLTNLWEFNGNANDIIGGANLTATGSVNYTTGKLKECLFLNGGYLYNGTTAGAINLADWSVSFWINLSSSSTELAGILCQSVRNSCYGFRIRNNGIVNYVTGTTNIYSTNPVVAQNSWTHICMVLNENKLYANGEEKSLTGTMMRLNINSPIYVGVDNYDLIARRLYGHLEQLALWNRPLTQAEVLKLYNNGKGLKYN